MILPIKAGESREVTLTVPKEELGYWNAEKQMFVVEPGTVKLLIEMCISDSPLWVLTTPLGHVRNTST